MMTRTQVRLTTWIDANRWLVVLGSILLSFSVGAGLPKLSFSNDYRHYFSEENPDLTAWESMQNTYAKSDNVLIALSISEGSIFTREGLAAIDDLTTWAWTLPYSSRVDSIANFQHARAHNRDLVVNDLVRDPSRLDKREMADIQKIALSQPELVGRLIAPSGKTAAVNVTFALPDNPVKEVAVVADKVNEAVARYREKYPNIEFHATGSLLFNHALAHASRDDVRTLVPSMYGVVLILLWLFLRSAKAVAISASVITLATIIAMGAAGWSGVVLSAASISAPIIIFTIALANCVHIYSSIFRRLRAGEEQRQAVIGAVVANAVPVLLANATTAVGFLTMNASEVPPYRDLGNIVALGAAGTYILTMFMLPALSLIVSLKQPIRDPARNFPLSFLSTFVVRHSRAILWASAVIAIVIGFGVSWLTLNDMFVQWLDDRHEFRTDTDFVANHLSGLYRIDYSIESNEEGGVTDPSYLRMVEDFANWYRQQPHVVHVHAFTNVMKRLNKVMHDDDQSYYRLPDERSLAAQYLLLYEIALPFGLDLNTDIDVNRSATRFVVTTDNISTRELNDLVQSASAWLKTNNSGKDFRPASTTILFAHIAERNIKSLIGSTVIGLVIISFALMIPLRSAKLAVISLVPNLLPGLIGFGLWGLFVGNVGLPVSIVIGMTLGIVVDDTIHLLYRYTHARKLGADGEGAVHLALSEAGPPMIISTTILIAGFLVLATSGFSINSQMGLLTAVVLAVALLADLFLTPALLILFDKRAPKRTDWPAQVGKEVLVPVASDPISVRQE